MSNDYQLAIAILAVPLLGFLVQALFGKALVKIGGKRLVGALAVLPIVIAFGIAAMLTMKLSGLEPAARSVIIEYFPWIKIQGFNVPFELLVDPLSMTMALIITGVGALIHLYATTYMAEDRDFARFFTYMNLFIVAMLLLVLGNNLVLLFVGWEGVGLCSYLLIGFWFKDLANAKAANKAFIVNRIGDWGLMLGLFLIVAALATTTLPSPGERLLSYDVMGKTLMQILSTNGGLATAVALLLFVGAAGKSAQFPLYVWLPDAMAGPTPVSALIHAATMVTSGVFLLNRMSYVFVLSPTASAMIALIGAFTAVFAAVIAFGQTDIKRVLAFSTVSQLGFMFIGCGAGAYWTGMFHVTTHAFFKALLFLGAGAVIYAMGHNQDMRNYGNLRKYMPITTFCMVMGWLAISGVPIWAGFFSKEAILGSALATTREGEEWIRISGWVGLGVAMLTAIYMTRLMALTFFNKDERWRSLAPAHGHDHAHVDHAEVETPEEDPYDFFHEDDPAHEEGDHHHELDRDHTPKEVPATMWLPLVVLAVLSLGGGWFLSNGNLFEHWLYPNGVPGLGEVSHSPANIPLMPLSIAAALLGIVFGLAFYLKGLPKDQGLDESKWQPWRRAAGQQFGFDYMLSAAAVEGGGEVGRGFAGFAERSIDAVVNGAGTFSTGVGKMIGSLQTGYVRLYALVMLLGGLAFVAYFLLVITSLGGGK